MKRQGMQMGKIEDFRNEATFKVKCRIEDFRKDVPWKDSENEEMN